MMLEANGVTLVLGGARSGKSAFAEKLASEGGREKVFLATCEVHDDEMVQRVRKHKSRRGPEWQLVEEPLELAQRLNSVANAQNCIVVDCLTLWLTNLVMNKRDIELECEGLVEMLQGVARDNSIVLVSSEVGHGIVPFRKMARAFRDQAGQLHQDIAAIADHVWFVTAGLPQKLK